MSKLSFEEVNALYLDVLKEIGNIGAGNATTTRPQGTVARPMPSTVAARNKSISIPSFLKKGDNKSAE